MTKWIADSAMDAHLHQISAYGSAMALLQAFPGAGAVASFGACINNSANGGVALSGLKAIAAGSAAGYTYADGATSGRRWTLGQQSSITVSNDGNCNHLALLSVNGATSGTVLLVTSVTSQALVAGNTATVAAFDCEVRDPT